MSLSDNEKLIIIQKREELRIISQEFLDLLNKEEFSTNDKNEIKKKILHLLSLINIIANQTHSDVNMNILIEMVAQIVDSLDNPNTQKRGKIKAQVFCFSVNIIPFSYSRWPSSLKLATIIASLEATR